MRLGILGGTFDPIHNGHLHMALCAQREYGLDEVWLMPTGLSPHKEDTQITSCEHRVNMARLAVEDLQNVSRAVSEDLQNESGTVSEDMHRRAENNLSSKISVSTLETDSNERSYTWRTLQRIHQIRPQDALYFIVGADSLSYMDHWVHPELIFRDAVILAAGRDAWHEEQIAEKIAQLKELYSADIRIVHCENLAVASRDIRSRIVAGEDVSDFLPGKVEAYIYEHGLYRQT